MASFLDFLENENHAILYTMPQIHKGGQSYDLIFSHVNIRVCNYLSTAALINRF